MVAIPTVQQIAEILRRAPRAQPWKYEAPSRALIRAALCLQGDKWWHADRVAFVTVAKARLEVGTRAPVGGDTDYDLSSWLEWSSCVICDHPFVPWRRSQDCCSYACQRRQRYLETRPVELARCVHCRDPMDVQQPGQKFCSTRCRKAAEYQRTKREWGRVRECRTCGGPISDSMRGDSLYCSVPCRNRWNRGLPGKVEARREQYRQAADVVVHTSCIQCGKPLPDGSNARRKFCSDACNAASYRARKANGHAENGAANADTLGPGADPRPNGAGGPPGDPPDPAAAAPGPPGTANLDDQRVRA